MPIVVSCSCGARLKAPDAAAGKRVKCPKCGTPIPVPTAEPDFELVDDDPAPVAAPPKKKPKLVDNEGDRPRPKSRRERDDEGDERPRNKGKKNTKSKSHLPLLVGAGVGAVVLLGVVGVVVAFALGGGNDQAKATGPTVPPNPGVFLPPPKQPGLPGPTPAPNPTPGQPPKPKEPEPVDPAPDFPLDPEPEYADFPAEFAAAAVKSGGRVTYTVREPSGVWSYERSGFNTPRPKGGIPLVRYTFGTFSQPMAVTLPECPVPFGVVLEGGWGAQPALLKALASQPNLEMVYTRRGPSLEGFRSLTAAPNLKRLVLRDVEDDAATAEVVKLFPKAVELDFESGTKVGSKTLAAVAGVGGLRKLSFKYCSQLTDADLARLSPLKDLRTLCLEMAERLTPAGVKTISQFDKLEHLDLGRGPRLGNGNITPLSRLTRLRYLRLEGSDAVNRAVAYSDVDTLALARLPHLATLDLGKPGNISTVGLQALAKCPELRELRVEAGANYNQLTALSAISQLEALSVLYWPKLTPERLKPLAEMPNLKRLAVLSSPAFDNAQLLAFCEAGRLEELSVAGPVSDAGFAKLGLLTKIRSLDVRGSNGKLTDAFLDQVAGVETLEELVLPRSPDFTPDGYGKLKKLTNLKRLSLSPAPKTPQSDAAVAELQQALPNCQIETRSF